MTRILLVDDDLGALGSTAELLQAFGYDVTTCSEANRVCDMIRKELPDLVLHDVRMPGLDIRAQVRSIRDDPYISHIPIVLFTAVFSAKELAREIGADDAIEKPFDSEVLRRVVRDSKAGRKTGS